MRRAFFAIAILAATALAGVAHRRAAALREGASEVDAHVWVPTPQAARFLSLGYNELLADFMWIRTLIYYGDGMVHDTGNPDVDKLIRVVNALDPQFRRPYFWGAHATTFRRGKPTQAEYAQSVEILRRAVQVFPDDWELSWLLGLRLYLDLKSSDPAVDRQNKEEGAAYIERAMRLPGAGDDLPLLAMGMRSKLGQREHALRELREMILTTENEAARKKLTEQYAALVNEKAGDDLAAAVRAFDEQWKRDLPFAPRTFYLLIGPRPAGAIDLRRLAEGDTFEAAE